MSGIEARRGPWLLAGLCALLWAAPLAAQERPERSWRRDVDRLIDRWSDDLGEGRAARARRALEQRLTQDKDDAEAMLELARLELATVPYELKDVARAARELAATYLRARERADRAATLLATRDREGKLTDGGGARHHAALALALLATQLHFQEALRARRLGGAKTEELRGLIQAEANELGRRRARLTELAGDAAPALLRAELRRRETLRELDRLGVPAPPLGTPDVGGKPIDLATYRGKPVLIVFWTVQVPESLELIKEVGALAGELGDALGVIAINLDLERSKLDAFLAQQALPCRHVHGEKGLASPIARAWHVRLLPDGALLDQSGKVRYLRPWEDGRGALRAAVADLLERGKKKP
ncbi:MAG: TlpA family protein disulfide reductase [Planctomycetota bacterium]